MVREGWLLPTASEGQPNSLCEMESMQLDSTSRMRRLTEGRTEELK